MTSRPIEAWLTDMDGVLVREQHAIAGADRWLARLRELGFPYRPSRVVESIADLVDERG